MLTFFLHQAYYVSFLTYLLESAKCWNLAIGKIEALYRYIDPSIITYFSPSFCQDSSKYAMKEPGLSWYDNFFFFELKLLKISNSQLILLFLLFSKFYAPWCGHCKKLEPIWNQVSQSLYPPVVRVAQVDCTRFPNVASEFKVKGFPTLIL